MGELITIEGIEETCKRLDQLPKRIVANCFASPLMEVATKVIMPQVVNNIPPTDQAAMHGQDLTGMMAAHIAFEIQLDQENGAGRVWIAFDGEDGKHLARLVELGHDEYTHYEKKTYYMGKDKRGRKRKLLKTEGGHVKLDTPVEAHPFMRPALEGCVDEAVWVFTEELERQLAMLPSEIT